MPARSARDGAALLAQLKRNPPEVMGAIPERLTAEALDELAGQVSRGGGGPNRSITPDKAMERLESALKAAAETQR